MMEKAAIVAEVMEPVPTRYRGVWQRTLLDVSGVHDTTTTVRWLQTNRWHADIRIPAARPDFSQVRSLDDCDASQLAWLTQQQGFAGITEVTQTAQSEICSWHRLVDYRPPATTPDAGFMQFDADRVVETGVHAVYLENWDRLHNSDSGFAVLQRLSGDDHRAIPRQFLMIAGDYVMHVRERRIDWPEGISFARIEELDDAEKRILLDFEISFGRRNAGGWRIEHSTLPWLEQRQMDIQLTVIADHHVEMSWNGIAARWQIHEWQAPA